MECFLVIGYVDFYRKYFIIMLSNNTEHYYLIDEQSKQMIQFWHPFNEYQ